MARPIPEKNLDSSFLLFSSLKSQFSDITKAVTDIRCVKDVVQPKKREVKRGTN
jgi:hypothetical protein